MRVLHFVPGYAPAASFGGPIESTHRLCQALKRRGADVRVLTTQLCGPGDVLPYALDTWVEHEGVPVRYCRSYGRGAISPSFAWQARRLVTEADVAHVTGVFSLTSPVATIACVASGLPFVVSPRGSLLPWAMAHRRLRKAPFVGLLRQLFARASAMHATSVIEGSAITAAGVQAPVAVIPNGVDISHAASAQPELDLWRRRLRLGTDTRMLLMLGRVHEVKGIDITIRALPDIRRQGMNAVLVVAGPDAGGEWSALARLAQEVGVGAAVHWVGPVAGAEKFQLLAEASVLLLPSRQENFGNVVLEALSVGTPVVASRNTPWAVLEERGLGVWSVGAPADIAQATGELLGGGALPRDRLRERARTLIAEAYTWDAVASSMLELYESVRKR